MVVVSTFVADKSWVCDETGFERLVDWTPQRDKLAFKTSHQSTAFGTSAQHHLSIHGGQREVETEHTQEEATWLALASYRRPFS